MKSLESPPADVGKCRKSIEGIVRIITIAETCPPDCMVVRSRPTKSSLDKVGRTRRHSWQNIPHSMKRSKEVGESIVDKFLVIHYIPLAKSCTILFIIRRSSLRKG